MKYKNFLIVILLLISYSYYSYSQALNANMKYAVFYAPEVGPYVETYLLVNGNTVTYHPNESNKLQGAINLSVIFQKNDTVANFSKIQLKSPEIDTTQNNNVYNFMDYQRFALPNGTYEMIVRIADAANPTKDYEYKEYITLDFNNTQVYVSGIELLDSYTKTDDNQSITYKNGYKLVPRISTFYPENISKLTFYCELYNVASKVTAGEPFLVMYYLRGFESQQQLTKYSGFKRMNSSTINILMSNFDIHELASGNYELVIEARDKNNQLLAKNLLFFQRSNPNIKFDTEDLLSLQIANSFVANYRSIDTLRDFISSLYPRATTLEKQFIFNQAKSSDIETLQRFFLNFWTSRNATNPQEEWVAYKKLVDIVNHEYKAVGMKGYQTDRGRIYLQYGPPNTIVDRDFDASSSGLISVEEGKSAVTGGVIPYQIWHYYQLSDNQRNKRFVFANSHLAANIYELIHSDANGELYNPQWQSELQRQIFKSTTIQDGTFRGETGEFYNVPY